MAFAFPSESAFALAGIPSQIDMPELRVTIRMIVTLFGLAVTLQAVPFFSQELGDFGVADLVMSSRQLRGKRAGTLAGPAQRRLRVAARGGLNHAVQGRCQAGIIERQGVPAAALMANPTCGQRRGL
jgi:hypothetical protein